MKLTSDEYAGLTTALIKSSSMLHGTYSEKEWIKLIEKIQTELPYEISRVLVNHLKSVQELKQKNNHNEFELRTFEIIQNVNKGSFSLAESEDLLKNSVKNLKKITKADIVFIILIPNGKDYYKLKSIIGANTDSLSYFKTDIGKSNLIDRIANDRRTIIIEDYADTDIQDDYLLNLLTENEGVVSVMGSPLITNNEQFIGAVFLARRYPYQSSEFLVKMLTYYCKQLAIALGNIRLYTNELRITQLHKELFEKALSDGYFGIVQKLCEFINIPILLIDNLGNNLYKASPYDKGSKRKVFYDDKHFIAEFNINNFSVDGEKQMIIGRYTCTIFSIKVYGAIVGYLIIPREFSGEDHIDTIAIEQSKNILALKISQEEAETRVELQLRQDYLLDLILASDSDGDLLRRGRHLKFNFDVVRKIIILDLFLLIDSDYSSDRGKAVILERIKRLLQLNSYSMSVIYRQELIVAVEETKIESIINIITDYIKSHYTNVKSFVGISNAVLNPSSYVRGFTEASKSVDFAKALDLKKVIHYKDLGVIGELFQENSFENLAKFRDTYLGPLLEYDEKNNQELVKTLETFLNNESVIQTSANELYIHYNTLRNRINRIKKILNDNLRSPQVKLNLRISLTIHRLLSSY